MEAQVFEVVVPKAKLTMEAESPITEIGLEKDTGQVAVREVVATLDKAFVPLP